MFWIGLPMKLYESGEISSTYGDLPFGDRLTQDLRGVRQGSRPVFRLFAAAEERSGGHADVGGAGGFPALAK